MTYFKTAVRDNTRSIPSQFISLFPNLHYSTLRPQTYTEVAKTGRHYFANIMNLDESQIAIVEMPLFKDMSNFEFTACAVSVETSARETIRKNFEVRCRDYGVYCVHFRLEKGDVYAFMYRNYIYTVYVTNVPYFVGSLARLIQTIFLKPVWERLGFEQRGKRLFKNIGESHVCVAKEWMDVAGLATSGHGVPAAGSRRTAWWEQITANPYFDKALYTSVEALPKHEYLTAIGVDISDFFQYLGSRNLPSPNFPADWKQALNRHYDLNRMSEILRTVEEAELLEQVPAELKLAINKLIPGISEDACKEAMQEFQNMFKSDNDFTFFMMTRLPSTLEARLKPICEKYRTATEVEGPVIEEPACTPAPEIPEASAQEIPPPTKKSPKAPRAKKAKVLKNAADIVQEAPDSEFALAA